MWSALLALLTVYNFVALAYTKIITTTYLSDGAVEFDTGGVALNLLDKQTCRDQNFTLVSTSVDGATVSFTFTGTAITLNCFTDVDRGLYTISTILSLRSFSTANEVGFAAVDGGNLKTVSGISSARSCTAIYSVAGLDDVEHNFFLKTAKPNLWGMTNDTSAKFEFISFEVTVPDDPTPTTTAIPGSTPSNSILTIPTATDALSSSVMLPVGAIIGIVAAAVCGLAAIAIGFFFFGRRGRASASQHAPNPQTPKPETSQYRGYPEIASSGTPSSSYTHPHNLPDPFRPYSYTLLH